MNRHEPLVKRDMTVFEDRVHGDGELLTARAALPNAFAIGNDASLIGLPSNGR